MNGGSKPPPYEVKGLHPTNPTPSPLGRGVQTPLCGFLRERLSVGEVDAPPHDGQKSLERVGRPLPYEVVRTIRTNPYLPL